MCGHAACQQARRSRDAARYVPFVRGVRACGAAMDGGTDELMGLPRRELGFVTDSETDEVGTKPVEEKGVRRVTGGSSVTAYLASMDVVNYLLFPRARDARPSAARSGKQAVRSETPRERLLRVL